MRAERSNLAARQIHHLRQGSYPHRPRRRIVHVVATPLGGRESQLRLPPRASCSSEPRTSTPGCASARVGALTCRPEPVDGEGSAREGLVTRFLLRARSRWLCPHAPASQPSGGAPHTGAHSRRRSATIAVAMRSASQPNRTPCHQSRCPPGSGGRSGPVVPHYKHAPCRYRTEWLDQHDQGIGPAGRQCDGGNQQHLRCQDEGQGVKNVASRVGDAVAGSYLAPLSITSAVGTRRTRPMDEACAGSTSHPCKSTIEYAVHMQHVAAAMIRRPSTGTIVPTRNLMHAAGSKHRPCPSTHSPLSCQRAL
jgi:hypothetical protein